MYKIINFLSEQLTWMSKKILSDVEYNITWTSTFFFSEKNTSFLHKKWLKSVDISVNFKTEHRKQVQ